MTRAEAEWLVKSLMGWVNPQIVAAGRGQYVVTAVDPYDNQRKTYNPRSGFFT
jgi:hypothetical protein